MHSKVAPSAIPAADPVLEYICLEYICLEYMGAPDSACAPRFEVCNGRAHVLSESVDAIISVL
jgi:hypothetical protein